MPPLIKRRSKRLTLPLVLNGRGDLCLRIQQRACVVVVCLNLEFWDLLLVDFAIDQSKVVPPDFAIAFGGLNFRIQRPTVNIATDKARKRTGS